MHQLNLSSYNIMNPSKVKKKVSFTLISQAVRLISSSDASDEDKITEEDEDELMKTYREKVCNQSYFQVGPLEEKKNKSVLKLNEFISSRLKRPQTAVGNK